MKAYTLDKQTEYYVENLEEVFKRRDKLIKYREDQWNQIEYEEESILKKEANDLIKKFISRKVISILKIIKNIPPTDETKVRTYTRELNRIKDYCNESTLEEVLEELEYYPEQFKDLKDLPNEYKIS